jgi:hypothetical protein
MFIMNEGADSIYSEKFQNIKEEQKTIQTWPNRSSAYYHANIKCSNNIVNRVHD